MKKVNARYLECGIHMIKSNHLLRQCEMRKVALAEANSAEAKLFSKRFHHCMICKAISLYFKSISN